MGSQSLQTYRRNKFKVAEKIRAGKPRAWHCVERAVAGNPYQTDGRSATGSGKTID